MNVIGEKWYVKAGRWIGPAIVSSLMVGPVGCSGGPSASGPDESTAKATATAKHDGETLFRGVMFAQGPAASLAGVPANAKIESGDPRLSIGNVLATLDDRVATLERAGNDAAARALADVRARIANGEVSEKDIRDAVRRVDASALGSDLASSVVARIRATDPSYFDRFAEALYSGDHVVVDRAVQDAAAKIIEAGGESPQAPGVLAVVIVLVAFVAWALFVPHTMPSGVEDVGLRHDEAVDRLVKRLSI